MADRSLSAVPPARRIGVIGDVHSEHERLETALDWFAGQNVDGVICTGDVVAFEARVQRTVSEQAYRPFRIPDDPFQVKFTRWPAASPDGSTLAFQAVGRIWLQDLPNGTPRRLTADDTAPFEFAPAWSPDASAACCATCCATTSRCCFARSSTPACRS